MIFNEAVASQYIQAKQQQLSGKLEVLQLQNAVRENAEVWEMAAVSYKEFNFEAVPQDKRKFVRLLAKDLGEIDWSHKSVKCWIMLKIVYNVVLFRKMFCTSGKELSIVQKCFKNTEYY